MDKTHARSLNIKIGEGIIRFAKSDLYLILVATIVFIAWVSKSAAFGFTALIALSCVVLLFSDNFLLLTPNIFSALLMVYSNKVDDYLYMWPTFIPLGICMIVFFVRNFKHKFTLGKLFFPLLAVSVALLIGGIGVVSSQQYMRAFPISFALGFGVLIFYVVCNHYVKRDESFDSVQYFARMLMYIGLVICLELIIIIASSGVAINKWNTVSWDVGWGNRNNVATQLIFTAGMTMYLTTRRKHSWVYYIIAAIQYLCLVMTLSRGGVLFGAVSCVFALIFSVVKAPNKKRQLITLGIAFGILLVFGLVFMHQIGDMVKSLLARGVGTSGRDKLYAEAWELFKEHWFIGVGMGHVGPNAGAMNVMGLYWFHSTLFQVMGCLGIIGILSYAYFYGTRLYLIFRNSKSAFNLFVFVVWIGFEGYSMIDTGTMVPFPNMMLIALMTLLMEINNKQESTQSVYCREPRTSLGVVVY